MKLQMFRNICTIRDVSWVTASLVSGHDSTVWLVSVADHKSICLMMQFLAAHWPCLVWIRFRVDHSWRGRSKPGHCRTAKQRVGS